MLIVQKCISKKGHIECCYLCNYQKQVPMKQILLTIITFLIFLSTSSAQRIVSGQVISDEDQLPGVNVTLKGTSLGTTTDLEGNYSLNVPEEGGVLIYSFIGFKTQNVLIGSKYMIDINLIEDVETLSEVIVVGYGTQSRQKITSSVSTVDEKSLKRMPVPNISNALEGLATGLFVRQSSGEPGFSSSSFEVRNFGNALVIVDGSPGNIDELDPNEIESITVLKDAAAAVVYGVQGGNGVVVITTKRGDIGKPTLTYSNQFTFTSFTAYPDFINSMQYATVLNEGLTNAGQAPFYTNDQINLFESGIDPINYPNENWKDLMFRKYGFQQRHNLNLSGGSEKIRYFVSTGFLDQSSNYTEDVLSYKQFNLRSNIDAEITEQLSLQVNLGIRRRLNEAPAYSAYDIFRELSRALPTNLASYPDGTPVRPQFSPNHIIEGVKDFNSGYYRAQNNNIDTKATLKWDVSQVPGLTVKSYGSLIYNNNFMKQWGKSYDLFTLNRSSGNYQSFTASPEGSFSETVLTLTNRYENHYVLQESLNYDNFIGNHSFSGLLLWELQKRQGEDFFGRRQDYQSDLIDQLFAGSNENKDANGGAFNETRLGLVGRLAYDYLAKYFVEGSFRYDGSSKFAPGKEWGFFPSLSIGWRLSEESFFPEINVLQDLKLRASAGTAGNDGTAAYQWLSGFTYNHFFAINETAIPTIDNASLPNEDLTWETITTYDIGLDATLLNKSLTLTFDYFYRDRKDVLAYASASVPSTLGIGLAAQNLFSYSNEGYEIAINYSKRINSELKVSSTVNFSRAREKAIFIDEAFIEDPFMRENLAITGGFTGLRRGYISDGLFQNQEEINAHAVQDGNGNTSIQPGDVKYKDLNNDGNIDVIDQKVFGNGDKPSINYSMSLGTEYKNFTLNILLTGAAGYDIYLDGEAQSPLRNGFNGYTYQLDYWNIENTNAAYPRITDGGFNDNNYRYSDFWKRNGSHLRVKNITLSYTLPKVGKLLSSFEELKVFFTGYNLLVIKGYNEEFDPQMQSGTGWYYPQNKSFTFGLNLTL